ncbi:MAG TPA: hypothetical protein PKM48_03495 [Parvularculaceae bacterium]|nr:hypothetical protein [Parvularculaceae bacterium]HNS86134.1 hypothetical protein [Parvularculaceae bacterium]
MTSETHNHRRGHGRRHGRKILLVALAIIIASLAGQWALGGAHAPFADEVKFSTVFAFVVAFAALVAVAKAMLSGARR